ncbi:MAG: hypothetical protein FI707_09850 [SAR202 cluster bacterium]|jgi:hypothetical protein|nr:hypothetical protein [Acidobacteriota bacterium]MDP6372747.1 pilus assembly protein N-terminal domain-containing protein [Vicinamibacterales bacterium]MDP6663209.1 pilus assembly protein N-terminal domain-containing protein [SAR202 cluster bacterium]MQG69079.1 hypothetical protein [SAR202 cluster bacterium]HAK54699.1 hypothetical protein [Acidobacteriota bacterium]|tara:strand:- start:3794 stop:4978 length:1185 start_codon:yes stop_codon:yes gene_type:complete
MNSYARRVTFVIGVLTAVGTVAAAQAPERRVTEEPLFVKEQRVLTPGFAIGDIAIGDPTIADYTVMSRRRELVLTGNSVGRTTLTVWDQNNANRLEILITVTTREAEGLEQELRQLITAFPDVDIQTLAGSLVLSGTVERRSDLEAVQAIADAAGVRNLVRALAPRPAPRPAPRSAPGPVPATDLGEPGAEPGGADAEPSSPSVEYDVELLETDVRFVSRSYLTGIEPSGRRLFKGVVKATAGTEGWIFMGGPVVFPEISRNHPSNPIGIRLTLRTPPPEEQEAFVTNTLVETNLPYDSPLYDPAVMRRARWELTAVNDEPIAIAGIDLMAISAPSSGSSKIGGIFGALGSAAGLPGVSSVPGAEYARAPVYFNADKKTHLLVVIRSRIVAGRR